MNNTATDKIGAILGITYAAVIVGSLGITIGAFVGCVPGLTSLSPFAVCSIAAVVSTTFSYCLMCLLACLLCGFFKMFDQSPDQKQSGCSFLSVEYIFSMVMGVGLSAAVNAIPGVILDTELAAELGGLIGVVALIAGFLATEYVIMPAIEKIKEYFSSQEKNSDTHTIEESDKPSSTLKSVDPSKNEDENKGLVAAKT